jgi:hypothetical protein
MRRGMSTLVGKMIGDHNVPGRQLGANEPHSGTPTAREALSSRNQVR